MRSDTAVVFVHSGYSWYLPYVLNQARKFRRDASVHLVGSGYTGINIRSQPIEKLETKLSAEFRSLYQHMSTNPASYELLCWLRWFYLLEYMRREKLTSVLYLDSDVLLFSTAAQINEVYGESMRDCAFWVPERKPEAFEWGIGSGHTSFWTADSLASFCEFALETFKNQKYVACYRRWWEFHQRNGIAGGVCDMVTFGLYWRENPGRITNLALPQKDTMFDHNIGSPVNFGERDYCTQNERKVTVSLEGDPYVVWNGRPRLLHKAHTLHFQGKSKFLIPEFYTEEVFERKFQCAAARRYQLWRRKLILTAKRLVRSKQRA